MQKNGVYHVNKFQIKKVKYHGITPTPTSELWKPPYTSGVGGRFDCFVNMKGKDKLKDNRSPLLCVFESRDENSKLRELGLIWCLFGYDQVGI